VAGALVGACVGSFLATLALRTPEGWAGMWWGRSRCPACRAELRARDLVPLLSWLALRGRCRYCGASLGAWYPAVELAAAFAGGLPFLLLPGPEAVLAALLGWWLLALATIDLVAWILPDALTLPLVLLGLAFAAWGGPAAGPVPVTSPAGSALGALFGYLVLAALAFTYQRLRGREGLGLGDAKLLAAAGAWLGAERLPLVVLAAALVGLAMALVAQRGELKAETALPFGPALALAFWGGFLLAARG
jgi:leader peptidase (prepilin peptidase)/N-methyltransferase